MKKFAFFLSLTLCAGVLSGCTGTMVVYSDCTTEPAADTGAVKTGLAILARPSVDNALGVAEHDVTLVAVMTRGDTILDCVIDSLSASVPFDENGHFLSEDGPVATKNELGFAYGMTSRGDSEYEWFQQAEALAEFAAGKTMAQVNEAIVGGYAREADLASCATIYLGNLVAGMEAAVANAGVLGAQEGDQLHLATINTLSGGDLNCSAVALTTRDGVITSCCLDALDASLVVSDEGSVSVGNTSSKNTLGESYGMVAWGGARYEWFRQAEHFAAYVTGKTPAQVSGIAVTEGGLAADADLAASVTISIAGFQALIAKTE